MISMGNQGLSVSNPQARKTHGRHLKCLLLKEKGRALLANWRSRERRWAFNKRPCSSNSCSITATEKIIQKTGKLLKPKELLIRGLASQTADELPLKKTGEFLKELLIRGPAAPQKLPLLKVKNSRTFNNSWNCLFWEIKPLTLLPPFNNYIFDYLR